MRAEEERLESVAFPRVRPRVPSTREGLLTIDGKDPDVLEGPKSGILKVGDAGSGVFVILE